uniref:Nuclear receptor domain-containing protein n=2 Tax=Bursaphelenchus xylophilus TaxID=6326 RepID=A0A1I7S1K7_BURXY
MRTESTSNFDEECAVCYSLQATTHFGVNTCRSCAAFFRRSIVLHRSYVCRNGGKCNIEQDARVSCPSCRFKKCIKVGMESEKIRPNFDKNGPRPEALKKRIKPKPPQSTVLPQMIEGYRRYLDDTKTLYFAFNPERVFNDDIVFRESTVKEHYFFDRTAVAYYVKMLNRYFCPFKDLSVEEKKTIFDTFHFQLSLLNMSYLNTVYFPDDENKQFLHFGGYTDIVNMEYFFSQNKNPTEIKK